MNKYVKSISFYILLFAVVFLIFGLYSAIPTTPPKTYSDLYLAIKGGNVSQLVIVEQTAKATLRDSNNNIEVIIPSIGVLYEDLGEDIRKQIENKTLEVDVKPPPSAPWWITILPTLVLIIIFVIFWVFFLQQSQGAGGGRVMQFGKSKARMASEDSRKYTFSDVAGADEEKEEL